MSPDLRRILNDGSHSGTTKKKSIYGLALKEIVSIFNIVIGDS